MLKKVKKGDGELIKNLNLGVILEAVKNYGPVSRSKIAGLTGLSKSTCSLLVENLLTSGLVKEMGKEESSGGRKPVLLEINYDAGIAVGIKLMEQKVLAALVDFTGEAGEVVEEKIDRKNDTASYIESLVRVIKRILETENEKSFKRKILGIGIGVSGLVDSEEGVLLQSSILNWNGVPIREILQKEFSIPVYLENDVNTFAIGEKILGSGKSYDNFICVTIGRGVGMGSMINGKIYRGSHNGSGEFGHMKVCADSDAPLCSCGKRGCVEAYASDPAICGFVSSEIAKGKESILADKRVAGIADILGAARQGDSLAVEAFRMAGHFLGYGIANLINLFDPEMVIIGGEGTTAGEFIFPEMKKVIKENTVYGLAEKVKLIPIVFENNLWVRGAATLVIREVFSIPF
ncbi:MAG: ROK family protein [Spirochaetes bacterium]|nr:ROK family protein [Spirochaetota bacterium]